MSISGWSATSTHFSVGIGAGLNEALDARGALDFARALNAHAGSPSLANALPVVAQNVAPWTMSASYMKVQTPSAHADAFCAAHGTMAPSPRPIDGPMTETEVSDFTALLDSSWYNLSSAGPPVTDKPIILTYSFEIEAFDYLLHEGYSGAFSDSFVALTAGEMDVARASLAAWADISGIVFIEVPPTEGDIQFGKYDFDLDAGTAGFAGFAYYGSLDDSSRALTGDVFLDTESAVIDMVVMHEIGHTLGFKHPFEGDPTLDEDFDNHDFTVMSYTGGVVDELGPFDVDAVHEIYGFAGDDGDHVSSWSWNASKRILTQTGKAGADTIRGIHGKDKLAGAGGGDTIYGNAGKDKVNGDAGDDTLRGGEGNDTVNGGDDNDDVQGGAGNDKVLGGDGDDLIVDFNGANKLLGGADTDEIVFFTASDVDGGTGTDEATYWQDEGPKKTLKLKGVADGFTISDGTTVKSIEDFNIVTAGGKDKLTFDNLGDGEYFCDAADGTDEMIVDYSDQTVFVLSGESGGGLFVASDYDGMDFEKSIFAVDVESMRVTGGSAGDFLGGGDGADTLTGGGGGDSFTYDAASESTGAIYDRITDFDAGEDFFDVFVEVDGVETAVATGSLSRATFDSDLASEIGTSELSAGMAVLFTPSAGNLAGRTFLIIDQGGGAGYDPGADLVIDVTGGSLGGLSAGNFFT